MSVIRSGEELHATYFARQLRGAERNYSATEMEALAVVAGIKHFTHHLYGREFVAQTDHKKVFQEHVRPSDTGVNKVTIYSKFLFLFNNLLVVFSVFITYVKSKTLCVLQHTCL